MRMYKYRHTNCQLEVVVNKILYLWVSCFDDELTKRIPSIEEYIYRLQKKIADTVESHLLARITNGSLSIDNVIFVDESTDLTSNKEPHQWIFVNRNLDDSHFNGVDFDDAIFIHVSAHSSKFTNCRFRNALLLFCDIRYSEFDSGTFENARLYWCDFYRAYFLGVIRFAKAIISFSSLNNTYFSSGCLIRKQNFENKRLLQENTDAYRMFLVLWDAIRSDKIKNDDNKSGEQKIKYIINNRHSELELIYKSLSSTFSSNGFSNDANWAYVKGKREERSDIGMQIKISISFRQKLRLSLKWGQNYFIDKAFGYGEGLTNIFLMYIALVFIFACLYVYNGNIDCFLHAFYISLKNMIGMSSNEMNLEDNVWLSLLNLVQTTFGILLTGIFGFILGNKIRD